MPEMTNDQVTRVLAEIRGLTLFRIDEDGRGTTEGGTPFDPLGCRNDLAEVLAKLTPEQWSRLDQSFTTIYYLRSDASSRHSFTRWLLTCDPAIIARAVAEVVGKGDTDVR